MNYSTRLKLDVSFKKYLQKKCILLFFLINQYIVVYNFRTLNFALKLVSKRYKVF